MSHRTRHPRPAVTVDCVILGPGAEALQVLLVQRDREPFRGRWALPGGFVEMNESLEAAALRELREETGLVGAPLEQLHTFGDVGRDPRGRVISVAYWALVNPDERVPAAGDDARAARWCDVGRAGPLAFDHDRILALALDRLRNRARRRPIGLELLPRAFTLSRLQRMYEMILREPLDRRRFRRRMLAAGLLVPLKETRRDAGPRAARLYRFDRRRYRQLAKTGFDR